MRVFVTGGTGFVGSAVVAELVRAGHDVLGLARSEAAAASLAAAGADVHRGDLADDKSLRRGAAEADGVVHCAFDHDADFAESAAIEREAIVSIGAELARSDRPFVLTSDCALPSAIRPLAEDAALPAGIDVPRAAETIAPVLDWHGVRAIVVRLALVHDAGRRGFLNRLAAAARRWGAAGYVGDGANAWPAVHVDDAAVLYRLALERNARDVRYHAVAEAGVPYVEIARAIGRGLGIPAISLAPDEAEAFLGFAGRFAGRDLSTSSEITRTNLGWSPRGETLLEDVARSFES